MKKLFLFLCLTSLLLLFTGCTKDVVDYETTILFQDSEITGKYTGQLVNGDAISDNAVFTYSDGDDYLNYTGGIENSQFTGNGNLETNFYVVHFSSVDRMGEYKGDVVDGIAKGNGTFTAATDDDNIYTYTGEWDNGLYNEYGIKEWEDDVYFISEGNFVDGDFSPTKYQYDR